MSISKYRAFLAAAELRNITKAADRLGYTQSGVSHLISALEAELGVTLLIRSKSGAVLTAEGEALLPYIRRVLEAEQDVRNMAIDLRGLTLGNLRIGTFSSVAIHWLPKILSQFKALYSGVSISVLNGDYACVEHALLNNTIDCGFVTLPSREEFTAFSFMRDRLLAVVDCENPLSRFPNLSPRDLVEQTFIVPAEGSNYHIGKLFADAGVAPRNQLSIHDDYAAVAMVRQRLGVTILPELMVQNLPMEGLRAIPLRGFEREIGIAVHRSRVLSPAIRAFLDCVRTALSQPLPQAAKKPSPH